MRLDFSTAFGLIYGGTEPRWHTRLLIERADGIFTDFTNLFGEDYVWSLDWGDSLDQPGPDLNVRLAYRRYQDNASPWVDGTRISGTLDVGRRIIVQARIYCDGMEPHTGQHLMLFDGIIDTLPLSEEEATIACRDRIIAEVQDKWIEKEFVAGASEGSDMDAVIINLLKVSYSNGFGALDPRKVKFRAPTPPDFKINEYKQQPMPVIDAVRALVDLIGWDIRPRWLNSEQAFGWVLYDPVRDTPVSNHTFFASQWQEAPRAEVSLEHIRNVVDVWYTDGVTLESTTDGGQYKKFRLDPPAIDFDSLTKYGRRWMEVGEGSTSPINTEAEARALAEAIVSDLSQSDLGFDVTVGFFPWVEINDVYTFKADGFRFGADQDLAVYSYRHTIDEGGLRTTMQVSGKPSSGRFNWLEKEARPGVKRSRPDLEPRLPSAASATSSTEGAQVRWSWPRDGAIDVTEVHRGGSADFTPGPDTIVDVVRGRSLLDRTVDLDVPVFYKVVAVDTKGNSSKPSPGMKATPQSLTKNKLARELRLGLGVSMSADQAITSQGQRVAFNTLDFPASATEHDAVGFYLEPNYDGLAHLNLMVMPSASHETTTWSATVKSGATKIASSGTRPGDQPLQIARVIKLDSAAVLEVQINYGGGAPTVEADGTVWSIVASQAGEGEDTPAPPVGVLAPVTTGTPKVGQTITCDASSSFTGTLITLSYQFRIDGVPVGADQTTHVLVTADASKYVDCLVTATTPNGGSVYLVSNRLGPIAPLVEVPQIDTPPTITIGS